MTRAPMTANMWRVLKTIAKKKRANSVDCKCSINTFMALELRGFIRVDTTFSDIVFPRNAHAVITDLGKQKLK